MQYLSSALDLENNKIGKKSWNCKSTLKQLNSFMQLKSDPHLFYYNHFHVDTDVVQAEIFKLVWVLQLPWTTKDVQNQRKV